MGRIPPLSALVINEIFGPTFQGEGPNIGRLSAFLRLAGCNLACVWCDTPYSWDWKRFDRSRETKKMSAAAVVDAVLKTGAGHCVVTGGEPMLQQRALATVTRRLHEVGWSTEIETAGTIEPRDLGLVSHWNVSPKLANSGNDGRRYNPAALDAFNSAPSRAFKFVISDLGDFAEVDNMVKAHGLHPVYIMPEGVSGDTITATLQRVVGAAIERGYNITTRLHVAVYGARRGV